MKAASITQSDSDVPVAAGIMTDTGVVRSVPDLTHSEEALELAALNDLSLGPARSRTLRIRLPFHTNSPDTQANNHAGERLNSSRRPKPPPKETPNHPRPTRMPPKLTVSPNETEVLDSVWLAYRRFDYPTVIALARPILDDPSISAFTRASSATLAGAAAYLMERYDDASSFFHEVWTLYPNTALSSTAFPEEIRTFFIRVGQEKGPHHERK